MHLQWRPIALFGGSIYSHTPGQSPKNQQWHHRYMRAIVHLAVCMSKLYLSFLTVITFLLCIKIFKTYILVNTHVVDHHQQQHHHISSSSSSPSHFQGDYVNNGFLMVSSNGGLNQMRAGVSKHVIRDFAYFKIHLLYLYIGFYI